MSTNRKNRDKPVLRNMIQVKDIARRNILTNEVKLDTEMLRELVDDINELIGTINRKVSGRNIPYIGIEETRDHHNLDKTRVLLRSEASDNQELSAIESEFRINEGNTFLVELYINDNGYIEIGCVENSNVDTVPFSNLVLCDREYLSSVLIDIFTDSAMFRSYSFLNELSVDKRRNFNQLKVSYLKSVFSDFTKLSSFYCFNNKNYKYLSMAFFVRKTENDIDLDALIELWDKFVQQEYPELVHVEPGIDIQLTSFVDIGQISNETISRCHQLPKGTYWILRVHRVPSNEHYRKWIIAVFGRADIGTVKIIKFDELDQYYELVRAQQITAFKIVIQ